MSMMDRDWVRRWSGVVVGVVATAVVCALYAAGLLRTLDDFGIDLHFCHFSSVEADPRVVLIDIDDGSLETVGDWPWPRRRYAEMVNVLSELGADRIVLDLVFSEPSAPRTEHAGLGPHYDVDSELRVFGDRASDPIIYDDDELRDAMTAAGNVYLAMFSRIALSKVKQPPAISIEAQEWGTRQQWGTRQERSTRSEARAPAMTPQGTDVANRSLARLAARSFLEEHPDGSWPAFLDSMLPPARRDVLSPQRESLLLAYRWADARRIVVGHAPAVPPSFVDYLPHAFDLTLPVDKLARASVGVGFVAFEREASGGVVRELPMLVNADGAMLLQLGFMVAMDVMGFDRHGMTIENGVLVLGAEDGVRLPLDGNGFVLLNWHAPPDVNRWVESFEHIPAGRVLEIARNRSDVIDNDRRSRIARGELVRLRHEGTPAEYTAYARLIGERRRLEVECAGDVDTEAGAEACAALERVARSIADIEREAVVWLEHAWSLWRDVAPADESEQVERGRIERLYARFGDGNDDELLVSANAQLAARSRDLLAALRPRVEGKICLVGYTASALGDLVTSPVFSAMPGVMAHANVINMLLQRSIARRASWLTNLVAIAIAGLIVTLTSCARGWRMSLIALVVLVGAVLLASATLFFVASYHVASLPVAVGVFFAWAAVTTYRQSTEERVRRKFERALAQYTSPAVASRISHRLGVQDLRPQSARVTCFFSDLEGFTELSERLGPDRTRMVLNPYLGSMSRVLLDRRAIVNKFIGDGIFAFFNAPIWPCSNHAEEACHAALDSVDALHRLSDGGSTEPLVMRIGLSTGEAFVGDYGSDMKLDYTCIGDTVNVGSRLETANKMLGTVILVDEATRRQAGESFAFRPIGLLTLRGKRSTVAAYELVAATDRLTDASRKYIASFERVIRDYQACNWDSCLQALRQCRKLR
ncbi:MAG: adenylate/guanylate cyclase domain-containing protein, partial [Planctomycetes bacterium]|nr:adenylate/guanylate cyclase domain-containing protein [Planctomycetota bacterium]